MTTKLHIGNMPRTTTTQDIEGLFRPFGLVASVVESQTPRAEAKEQTIHFERNSEPVLALMDSTVMVQVVENLVSNAVKYSPHGKNIFVTVKRTDAGAWCEVRDEGPGLSEEDQEKLFGKFARLTPRFFPISLNERRLV